VGLLDGTLCADDQQGESLSYKYDDLRNIWGEYKSVQSQPYRPGQPPTMHQLTLGMHLQRAAPHLDVQDFFKNLDPTRHLDTQLAGWISRQCNIQVPSGQLEFVPGGPHLQH
jgi:hypothetical protein